MNNGSRNTIVFVISLILLLAITSLSVSAAPADTVKIKVTTVQLDNQQMGKGIALFKQLVDERLAGKVELMTYTGGQLYSNAEELEAIKNGDIEMCFAVGSTMTTLDPTMSIFKLPYLFPNADVAYAIMDGEIGQNILANIHKQGINVLGAFSSGSVIISNSSHPIQMPADFSGLKLRASGKMESAIIDALGGVSTVIPSEETYTGLQQKVVDGLATPSTVFAVRKYHEVNKFVTNAGLLYWPVGFILANDAFWNDLPEDVRTDLSAIITEVLATMRADDAKEVQEMLTYVESEGCEIHTVTPEEAEAWKEATKGLYDEYADSIGADLIETVEKAVADFGE